VLAPAPVFAPAPVLAALMAPVWAAVMAAGLAAPSVPVMAVLLAPAPARSSAAVLAESWALGLAQILPMNGITHIKGVGNPCAKGQLRQNNLVRQITDENVEHA
jgi:hypothetical protein